MTKAQRVGEFFKKLLGFKKTTSYVKSYMNDANIRSSIYMTFIIIAIEIWMIIRSSIKYVSVEIDAGANFLDAMFEYTSLYWLFMIAAFAVTFFCFAHLRSKRKTCMPAVVLTIISAIILILFSFFIIKETQAFTKWDTKYYRVSYIGTILLYVFSSLLGLSTLAYGFIRLKKNESNTFLSVIIVIFFAAICLVFGVKVGYTDFFSRFYLGTGLPKAKGLDSNGVPFYEIKSIICFLTMSIFVACLLIWKPYISIVLMTSIFTGYYFLLSGDAQNRIFCDGEIVNYFTFLISIIAIAVSIYQQRMRDALKDEELEYIAVHDTLTEIHNMHYFETEADIINRIYPDSYDTKIFLFINIENFKSYNDLKGFTPGNKFLKTFGHKLEDVFGNDLVARQADDHFVAYTDIQGLEERLDKLEAILMELKEDVALQLKVGGSKPTKGETVIRNVDRARFACGSIKMNYGVRYKEYDEKMDNIYHKRQYIVNNIDNAVANGWIKAYYQPVVWSGSGELCGCEALARWIDPKYGFLSPGDFIPVLEEYRQIHKLDRAIFEIVCKDLRNDLDNGKKIVPVSLNFSRLDFELMDAVGELEALVEKYNLKKEYLHVEITESALTDSMNLLENAMERLRKDGYAIWLDDFGSGYSSLNVLKDYKFDVLKIDMKFLSNFSNNPKTKDVIDCIIQLANRLDMRTLTEGVETEEEAKFLESVGCGRLQGYLFGKPIPHDDILKQIEEGKYIISDKII